MALRVVIVLGGDRYNTHLDYKNIRLTLKNGHSYVLDIKEVRVRQGIHARDFAG